MSKRLLLISNSTAHGGGYLDHCETEIRDILSNVSRVVFIPFALHDRDGYARKARERLGRMGFEVHSLHDARDPKELVRSAEAFFTGGGNTFRLLDELCRRDLIKSIRAAVDGGAVYMGSSAGSNIACVTIKTTNDMPIVQPPTFDALNLVPFNINPHYLDPDPASTHMGETRETRIREFHEMNDPVVVGLREGSMLRIAERSVILKGTTGARVFRKGRDAEEYPPGSEMDFLLA